MKNAMLTAAIVIACTGAALAMPVGVDGLKGAEWNSPNATSTFTMSSGSGSFSVEGFVRWDADFVYAAFEADTSDAGWAGHQNFANLYVYSTTGGGGAYGDGDDVIVETTNQWGTSLNAAPWIDNVTAFSAMGGNVYDGGDVILGYINNSSSNFIEVAIDRDLLNFGSYSEMRFGGQLWSYDFQFQNFDVAGTVIPTPLAAI